MYVLSFHFISLCFVTSIFQIVWSVTSSFRDFPLCLIRFICYETEMGLWKKCLAKKSICFIVTLRYTLFRNKNWPRCLNCFILFRNKWNEWNRPSVRTPIGLFHLFHSFSVHFRVFLIYFNCFICFCYGEKNVPKKKPAWFLCSIYVTTGQISTKLDRIVLKEVFYQNCSNCSSPLHKQETRAKNRKKKNFK